MKATIGGLAERLIALGLTNQQVLDMVKYVFPLGNTKLHNISWYRSEMGRAGKALHL